MENTGKVFVNKNGHLCIDGFINFDNVTLCARKGVELMKLLPVIKVNLSRLQHADSSALALLVNWIRAANLQNKEIKIYSVPKFLCDLSKVSGLDKVLPIDNELS